MNTDLIHRYIWIGRKDINWYQECEKCLIDIFGKDKLRLVAKLFAATSINTSLKSNITLFRKALHEIENSKPVGERYLPSIKNQLLLIRDNKELSGRKINNFANAMSGNKNAVVVDIWITRAFGFEKKRKLKSGRIGYNSPTKKQYDIIEQWIINEANEMRIEPRQLCAMIWSGIRTIKTGDRETKYIDILKREFINLFTPKNQSTWTEN